MAMNNPKSRDDDQRSSIANHKSSATETEARRVVEGGEADKQSQRKEGAQKSQTEGPQHMRHTTRKESTHFLTGIHRRKRRESFDI
jgi:hypothetical protein